MPLRIHEITRLPSLPVATRTGGRPFAVTKTKPIDPSPVFQEISVLAEPSLTLTRSGIAVIRAASLILAPIPPSSGLKLLAIHGGAKQRTSQIVVAEKTGRRFAKTQDLTVAENDDALPVTIFIMERTFEFAAAISAADVSTCCLAGYDWLF